MNTVHNPDRFMGDLRQILSQGRKRIGFLIGAGAPLAIKVDKDGHLSETGKPLIPGVEALTTHVLSQLKGTQAVAANSISDGFGKNSNIEMVLSRIRLLETALGTSLVNGLDSKAYASLAKNICAEIGKVVGPSLPAERCAYNELISWISGTIRKHPIEIFTTNYDLLFEEAFEKVRAPYFDGFSGGHAPFFDAVTVAGDDLPARWSRLWKLHGSLGWAVENGAVVRGRGRGATELVYPDHLKYDLTQKQPYASLFERLKRFLLEPDTLLLAIGFSFRDAHVSTVLDEALAMNANTAVFAFQFRERTAEIGACKLAADHPNFSVYAADGAVVNGVSGLWQPGELPKNWAEIRASFWAPRIAGQPPSFLLGDFAHFSRFCALAQAIDVKPSSAAAEDTPVADAPPVQQVT
jgi:hypothetical protein